MRLRPPLDARPLSGVWYDSRPMRRLLRILLNAATAVSLVLCVAAVVLWVRSYRVADELTIAWPTQRDVRTDCYATVRLFASLGHGSVSCGRLEFAGPERSGLLPPPVEHRPRPPERIRVYRDSAWSRTGFDRYWTRTFEGFGSRPSPNWGTPDTATLGRSEEVVTAPLWSLAITTGACPALRGARAAGRWRGRRRARPGRCPACGYDLRATPGRCPECGVVPAGPPARATEPAVAFPGGPAAAEFGEAGDGVEALKGIGETRADSR
jgi:hypothetical protein